VLEVPQAVGDPAELLGNAVCTSRLARDDCAAFARRVHAVGWWAGAGAGRERVRLQVERPLQQIVRVVGEQLLSLAINLLRDCDSVT